MIISLAFSDNGLSPPEVKLITANYDTARVDDDCSPDEVSRDEVSCNVDIRWSVIERWLEQFYNNNDNDKKV